MPAPPAGLPRLLVLASTYPRWQGDPEPGFVHQLCKRLTMTFEVHVICPHAPGARDREHMDGVRIHRFRYAPRALETLVQGGGILSNLRHQPWKWLLVPLFMVALTWNTARLVRRLEPGCLHVHWIVPQGLALMLARFFVHSSPPFLLTSHGGDIFGLRGALLARLKRWVVRRADAVSVVSRPMARLALELGAKPDKLAVIPMGVDFDGLFTVGSPRGRQPGAILFVGRLVEKKGLKYLIQALPVILSRIPGAHLTIAGYGPEECNLRAIAEAQGVADKVSFLGATVQADLPALYRQASVFAAPFIQAGSGDQEGLPVALMEAIACGCPIVAGDLDVLADIFEPGESDMRVDPRDIQHLAGKIMEVLEHPAESLHRAAILRTRLAQRLGWDRIANQYAELLQEISSPHGRTGV